MTPIARPSRVAAVLLVAGAILLPSCGGGGSSPTGPTAQPTPTPGPTKANITVGISNTQWGPSLVSGFSWACGFDIRIRESAGLAANLNYVRADFFSGTNGTGAQLERRQLPGRNLNQLPANGTLADSLVARFNAGNARSVVLSVRFTDVRGNVLETTYPYNCCTPWIAGGLAR